MDAEHLFQADPMKAEGDLAPTTVEQMHGDLAELAAAERRRARMPRYSQSWDQAITAEELLVQRIRGWIYEDKG